MTKRTKKTAKPIRKSKWFLQAAQSVPPMRVKPEPPAAAAAAGVGDAGDGADVATVTATPLLILPVASERSRAWRMTNRSSPTKSVPAPANF
jgi:hypothetical protein